MSAKGAADIEIRQEGVLNDINMAPGHLMSHLFWYQEIERINLGVIKHIESGIII